METLYPGQPFLPHLARLIAQLEMASVAKRHSVQLQLEHLPYTLRAMETAFEEFLLTANHIMSQYSVHDPKDVMLIRPFHRDRLNTFVDLFLDTARRTQNALIPYLRQRYGINPPNSMADFVKKFSDGVPELPSRITNLIIEYWHTNGRRLKDYRDLAQHHALVASDARLLLGPHGRPLLYLTLPNNPEIKSAPKLSYSDPVVHASLYMEAAFVALLRFCHAIVLEMIDLDIEPKVGLSFRFKDSLGMGEGAIRTGATVPTVKEIEGRFTKLLAELNANIHEHGNRTRGKASG